MLSHAVPNPPYFALALTIHSHPQTPPIPSTLLADCAFSSLLLLPSPLSPHSSWPFTHGARPSFQHSPVSLLLLQLLPLLLLLLLLPPTLQLRLCLLTPSTSIAIHASQTLPCRTSSRAPRARLPLAALAPECGATPRGRRRFSVAALPEAAAANSGRSPAMRASSPRRSARMRTERPIYASPHTPPQQGRTWRGLRTQRAGALPSPCASEGGRGRFAQRARDPNSETRSGSTAVPRFEARSA